LIEILHLDEHIVAIDKPAWAVVHRTRGAEGALLLAPALSAQLGAAVYPVHRLDRQTSGVLVFARSSEVAALLSADIRSGLWKKRYLGLCRGVVADSAIVDHPVRDDAHRRAARTQYDPLEHFCDRYTLLRALPETGRRHQVRYHLHHLRHPLVGDVLYGDGKVNRFFREAFALRRLFLHAEGLRILHPRDGQPLDLAAPLPVELQQVLAVLRQHRGPVA
jgi:tRNA pseudouridine65 synthase